MAPLRGQRPFAYIIRSLTYHTNVILASERASNALKLLKQRKPGQGHLGREALAHGLVSGT